MSNESIQHEPAAGFDTATRLSFQRTFLAYERTQMAWVRTALTLISFGFTIDKFFQYVQANRGEPSPLLHPHALGILLISIGLVALALGSLEHAIGSRRSAQCPGLPRSVAGVTAGLLALLGIVAWVAALLHL